ncbi:hypothetical protein [Yersinia proxima]|uniref:hypothetical protein n=1 Tax=Yersinia proxima TaxID=2890316 RepID=UPI003D69544C
MSREDMLYQIMYSHYLEKMFSIFTGRLDKTLSFALILLGSSVMANFDHTIIIGLAIAVISAVKMAFTFEATAEHSRKQAAMYLKLFNIQHQIASDEELLKEIQNIQDGDYSPWLVFTYPAMLRAKTDLGISNEIKLTRIEKLIARVSGGYMSQRN